MLSYWKICIFFGVFSCIVWETFQDCVFQGSRIDLLSPSLFRISQQFKKRQTALPVWIEVVGKVTVFSAFQGAWGGNCQGRSIFPNILKKGDVYKRQIQSFRPSEITPELALEIAKEFASEHLPGYQTVIGVHVDKEHIHAHILFNSVNADTGEKYHSNAQSLSLIHIWRRPLRGQHTQGIFMPESGVLQWSGDPSGT